MTSEVKLIIFNKCIFRKKRTKKRSERVGVLACVFFSWDIPAFSTFQFARKENSSFPNVSGGGASEIHNVIPRSIYYRKILLYGRVNDVLVKVTILPIIVTIIIQFKKKENQNEVHVAHLFCMYIITIMDTANERSKEGVDGARASLSNLWN